MNTPSATSAAPVARSIVPRRGRSPRRSGVRDSDATARSTSGAAALGLRPPNDRAGSERLGTLARQGRRTRDPRRRRAARAALGSPTLACPPERLQQGSGVHPRAQQAWSYRIDGGRAPSLLGRRHDARDLTPQPTDVTGTSWQVTRINNGKHSVVSMVKDSDVAIEFA